MYAMPSDCALATKSSISIKGAPNPTRSRLKWGFTGLGADFGDPSRTTSYAFCLFDGVGTNLIKASVPPGGTCGKKPCWIVKAGSANYKNAAGTSGGIHGVSLRNARGNARLSVTAKGANLTIPAIPVVLPADIILRRDGDPGKCWSSSFSAPSKNIAGTF